MSQDPSGSATDGSLSLETNRVRVAITIEAPEVSEPWVVVDDDVAPMPDAIARMSSPIHEPTTTRSNVYTADVTRNYERVIIDRRSLNTVFKLPPRPK